MGAYKIWILMILQLLIEITVYAAPGRGSDRCSEADCKLPIDFKYTLTPDINRDRCADRVPLGTILTIDCLNGIKKTTQCKDDGSWSHRLHCDDCNEYKLENMTTKHWHVGIFRMDDDAPKFLCGGTIISKNVIASSKHCFYHGKKGELLEPSKIKVAAGKIYNKWISSGTERETVQKLGVRKIHAKKRLPGRIPNKWNDIALLVLNEPLVFNDFVRPVCIASVQSMDWYPQNKYSGEVAGWSLSNDQDQNDNSLKIVDMPVIAVDECLQDVGEARRMVLSDDRFCAGHLNGFTACGTDAGSGLIYKVKQDDAIKLFLGGVASVGVPKDDWSGCRKDAYSIFTDVRENTDWINDILNENSR